MRSDSLGARHQRLAQQTQTKDTDTGGHNDAATTRLNM